MVLAGSSSKTSINKKLAKYAASMLQNCEIQLIDLNDFSLPIFSVDTERDHGYPENAKVFDKSLREVDGIILSLAEHNGSYTVAFKNLLDWVSRINTKVWKEKPMLLMATSPGTRGAISVLETAKVRFPHLGAKITGVFSLPSFYDNFNNLEIVDDDLKDDLVDLVVQFEKKL